MKYISAICFILVVVYGHIQAQPYYASNKAHITFFSDTPVEDISAKNEEVQVILSSQNNQIAVQMDIRSFHFKNKLMEEHFNENYLESDTYPKARFSGIIQEKIDYSKIGTQKITAIGNLEVHGVSQKRTLEGTIDIQKDHISIRSTLGVKLEDHNIDVPTVVFQKIAKEIEVKAYYDLYPLKNDEGK